jgi:hypothetical protein
MSAIDALRQPAELGAAIQRVADGYEVIVSVEGRLMNAGECSTFDEASTLFHNTPRWYGLGTGRLSQVVQHKAMHNVIATQHIGVQGAFRTLLSAIGCLRGYHGAAPLFPC